MLYNRSYSRGNSILFEFFWFELCDQHSIISLSCFFFSDWLSWLNYDFCFDFNLILWFFVYFWWVYPTGKWTREIECRCCEKAYGMRISLLLTRCLKTSTLQQTSKHISFHKVFLLGWGIELDLEVHLLSQSCWWSVTTPRIDSDFEIQIF